ncbi:hypothetical protein F8388_010714 [Cannabis sativa]|uniref:Uncharacterized protein n=1 Tax=Cannabis sativa TaxID=3483 RepID=A0A7J6FYN5_CANSA|nr:hypothetical protein G4B88_031032 [Cannabis sativa]KAF4378275.1 hypothetical protein F8388_010714 [Cannabis sativa]
MEQQMFPLPAEVYHLRSAHQDHMLVLTTAIRLAHNGAAAQNSTALTNSIQCNEPIKMLWLITPTSAELQPFVSTTIFSSRDFLFPFLTIPFSLFTPSFYTLSSTFLHRSSELSRLTDTTKGKKMGYWCSIKLNLVILVILIIEHWGVKLVKVKLLGCHKIIDK